MQYYILGPQPKEKTWQLFKNNDMTKRRKQILKFLSCGAFYHWPNRFWPILKKIVPIWKGILNKN